MPESDLKIIKNCSDDEKREHLHAMSKERLVELIIRLTRKKTSFHCKNFWAIQLNKIPKLKREYRYVTN